MSSRRVLSCKYCDYCSDCARNLRRHVMTHTGEKDHECPVCGYEAIEPSNVKRHMKTSHPQETSLIVAEHGSIVAKKSDARLPLVKAKYGGIPWKARKRVSKSRNVRTPSSNMEVDGVAGKERSIANCETRKDANNNVVENDMDVEPRDNQFSDVGDDVNHEGTGDLILSSLGSSSTLPSSSSFSSRIPTSRWASPTPPLSSEDPSPSSGTTSYRISPPSSGTASYCGPPPSFGVPPRLGILPNGQISFELQIEDPFDEVFSWSSTFWDPLMPFESGFRSFSSTAATTTTTSTSSA